MHNFNSESISVLYHHGSRIILNNNWHDKNVICPNSKIYYVLDGEIAVEIGLYRSGCNLNLHGKLGVISVIV